MAAFEAAYRQAKEQDAVFVAIQSLGEHWTVRADMITAAARRHRLGVRRHPRRGHPDDPRRRDPLGLLRGAGLLRTAILEPADKGA
ncbi:hypothetical protein [Streptomyces capoamus]|uniref:hypothetical protein n=1 Tax=Streptomyces capoamus TaxID=68183 RepID=UPI0033961D17